MVASAAWITVSAILLVTGRLQQLQTWCPHTAATSQAEV